ncbi:MAG: hypothetical protein Q9221_002512 [Calogaya cf. arnoldii]
MKGPAKRRAEQLLWEPQTWDRSRYALTLPIHNRPFLTSNAAFEGLDAHVALHNISEIDEYAVKLADLLYIHCYRLFGDIHQTCKSHQITIANWSASSMNVCNYPKLSFHSITKPRSSAGAGAAARRGGTLYAKVLDALTLIGLEDDNKVLHKDTTFMCRFLRDRMFVDTDDHQATPIARPRAFFPTFVATDDSDAPPERKQHPCPRELRNGELSKLIDKLKKGKAAGHDRVSTEVLKTAKDIILPYLERLFKACITLSHEPIAYQQAKTTILEKT